MVEIVNTALLIFLVSSPYSNQNAMYQWDGDNVFIPASTWGPRKNIDVFLIIY